LEGFFNIGESGGQMGMFFIKPETKDVYCEKMTLAEAAFCFDSSNKHDDGGGGGDDDDDDDDDDDGDDATWFELIVDCKS
jgi:hypothetical protein